MEPIAEVTLSLTKTTPGTYRFDAEDPASTIKNLYVQKLAFRGRNAPRRVLVRVYEASEQVVAG